MVSFVLDNGERITVVSLAHHYLDVEIEFPPGEPRPAHHVHPRQSVHFEVLSGTLHATCRHDESVLARGDLLDVHAGVPHRLWNPGPEWARALWRTAPAGRTLERFQALSAIERRHGHRDLAAQLVALSEFDDVYRYDLRPRFVAHAAVSVLAPVSKLWLWTRPAHAS